MLTIPDCRKLSTSTPPSTADAGCATNAAAETPPPAIIQPKASRRVCDDDEVDDRPLVVSAEARRKRATATALGVIIKILDWVFTLWIGYMMDLRVD